MIEVANRSFERREQYDLFLICGGYESRSAYFATLRVEATRRAAIRLPRVEGARYGENWELLRDEAWEPVLPGMLAAWLSEFLRVARPGFPLSIAVDISSMPRALLGLILEFFHEHGQGTRVTFLYCPAWFETSSRQARVDVSLSAQPVSPFFAGEVRPSHIPIGLVVGLGLESHRADGVREFLEPARVWAFVAQGLDERFVEAVLNVNEYFLRGNSAEALRYDIRDIGGAFRILSSLCQGAGKEYRMVLAPSGPKMFALAAMLVGLERSAERPAVWRVGPAVDPVVATDVVPTGEVVACVVRFLNDTNH